MKDHQSDLFDCIDTLVREGGSDLHFSEGRHPTIRVSGSLIPLEKKPVLTGEDTMGVILAILTPDNKKIFLDKQEIDFAYAYKDVARFRVNGFFQRGTVGIALRLIPSRVKTLEELSLPPILESFAQRRQGFFLAVGPVGQGKSTTLAAMVEIINQQRAEHILTIEDPIEYIFQQKRSIIDQRELRLDTQDFTSALKGMFRQDVNVAMIGEMRGLETMAAAVTAAETGHLVLSTLHTNNAAQTIDRIIDSFPAHQQAQIRVQLSATLTAIFSQRLIPRISGGMVPAYELLINNNAVSNLIRESRTHEINSVIETGLEHGMIDMNRSLAQLVRAGEITIDNARMHSYNPQGLLKII
jgi:twitching motility protein PilT